MATSRLVLSPTLQVLAATFRFSGRRRTEMKNRTPTGVVLFLLTQALAGCDNAGPSRAPAAPTAPSPVEPPVPQPPPGERLLAFVEASSGFSTTDVRDSQEQVVQITAANELIWTADGARLKGFWVTTLQGSNGPVHFIEGKICPECWAFEVRFGTRDGERRAYLTVDYHHDNPGTLVDVEVVGGALVVTKTDVFAPGTFTLSGLVTEVIGGRATPVAGAAVYRGMTTGWQSATTDRKGFYSVAGMYDSSAQVAARKDGYQDFEKVVTISGDTRFDIQLIRK
jgi:hypothetical protein